MNQDNQNGTEKKHKRRVRYKGTHPKSYKEKYKEHNPEKYADDVMKIIEKGSTPAGMHIPICVEEIINFLKIQPGQTGWDATLGYGGHSLEMLKKLNHEGHLYATDVDPIELPKTTERLAKKGYGPDDFHPKLLNFSQIDQVIPESGLFDFMLADLGISSMQIDNPDRGFSYKIEGPLDLRLNPTIGQSASERLMEMTYQEIEEMLIENADEPRASQIAAAISRRNKHGIPIETTTQLKDIITEALNKLPHISNDDIKKSCQRSFQAIRIDINQEFEVLDTLLEKIPQVMASGGRIAILTFHSGEDRRVKQAFKTLLNEGVFSEVSRRPTRPSQEECRRNGRAKSAKLRWAVKA